jgi:hypothetical protein
MITRTCTERFPTSTQRFQPPLCGRENEERLYLQFARGADLSDYLRQLALPAQSLHYEQRRVGMMQQISAASREDGSFDGEGDDPFDRGVIPISELAGASHFGTSSG